MYQPLISIIVPIYKVEEYLNQCINSIVNQTYKNLEIILIDDGSTDNTLSLANNFAKNCKMSIEELYSYLCGYYSQIQNLENYTIANYNPTR